MFKKIVAIILTALLVLGCLASCSTGDDNGNTTTAGGNNTPTGEAASLLPAPTLTKDFDVPETFKLGVICLHDENSTYDANFINAVKAVKALLGLKDEQVLIKTGIAESDDCYNAAIDLANQGCNLIFADSYGHQSFMAKAAKEKPEVQFCHATGDTASHGDKAVTNFHNAFASIYEGRYLAGITAGLKLNEMIAAGKITAEQAVMGYVGAFTYAEVISGLTSFYLGAKSVCPSVTMKVRYTGSWYDQALEQEAATTLIEQDHCVLISQHADSLGAPTACELHDVPNVSYNGSTYKAGKNTYLISSAINWQPYFLYIIKCVCTGEVIADDWTGTINTGSVVLTGVNLDVVAEGTEDALKAAIAKFKDGSLKVFDTSKFTVTVTIDESDPNKSENADATVDADGHLTAYLADVDADFTGETQVVHDGFFDESGEGFRSAPYFNLRIDGITYLNTNFG